MSIPSPRVTPEMARIARGASWSAFGVVTSQALAIATAIVTARWLSPQMFGTAAAAFVVTAVFVAIRDLGFSPAVASGRITDERTLSSAHWLVCTAGALATGIVVVAAPLAAAFFGIEDVTKVLRVHAVTVLLGSAIAVPQAMLQRAGRFATLAAFAVTSQLLVFGCVVISLSMNGGVWTLVVPGIIAAGAMVPLHWRAVGRVGPIRLGLRSLAPLLAEGAGVSGASLCTYLMRNSDNAIVGKTSGERALGLYAFAYNFLMQPLGLFSHALVPVLLPAFGRLEERTLRSDGVVRVTLMLLRVGAPVMLGGALTAPLFVPLVFGAQWAEAIPLVQVLMVAGALQIPGPVFGSLSLALGESRFLLRWAAGNALIAGLMYLVGGWTGGALGVARACLCYSLVALALMRAVTVRRFDLPLRGMSAGLGRIGRDVLIMVVGVLLARALGHLASLTSVAQLALEVSAGALLYTAAVRLLAPKEAELIVALLPRALARVAARVLHLA